MKRMNLPLLFVTACATVFMACKKEIVQSPTAPVESVTHAKAGSFDCAKKAQMVCGMLSFSDQAHFQYVYDCLYDANEAHLLSFETQYGYLSEDDYETMAESLNFVDEQALIDFESAVGFDSYRKHIAYLEDQFLAGGGDPFYGPGMNNLFDDQILETIANKDGAYMVGGTIHVRTAEGLIDFCSCEEYELYISDPDNYNFEENECAHKARLTFCSATCDCCKLYQLASGQIPYAGNKMIIWTPRFEYESFWQFGTILNQVESHRSCAKIQNFKLKNGNWKRRRADLYARTYGIYYDSSDTKPCDPPSNYTKHKAQRRKVLEATNWYPLLNYYKAFKTGEAEGYWEWPGGASLHKTLDFPC